MRDPRRSVGKRVRAIAANVWFGRGRIEPSGEPLGELATASREFSRFLGTWEPTV
jgi:hypothetical protein